VYLGGAFGDGQLGSSYGMGDRNLKKMNNEQSQLKEGTVVTYQVLQNTTTYQVRLTLTTRGLWMCIEESGLNWKLTITPEMVEETVAKASAQK
jgi:hypothetical protein